MTILVTGATGKIGSRLIKRLAQNGKQIRALIRDPQRALHLKTEGVEFADGDLLNASSLESAVAGAEAIVHCAAFFRGATPEQARDVNYVGTQNLANAARAAGVKRLLFLSTGLVYAATAGQLATEKHACAPAAAYPASKLEAERFLLDLQDLDVRVLRLPFVYGDGDPHVADIVSFMRGFSPAQRMSIAHHADVAQAIELLLDAADPRYRIYNVVDDEAPQLAELFATVGAPAPDGSDAARGAAFDTLLDGRRIRGDLGFSPEFPRLADAVSRRAL